MIKINSWDEVLHTVNEDKKEEKEDIIIHKYVKSTNKQINIWTRT